MEAFLHEVSDISKTLKTHKRYSLRLAALVSIVIGSILNFISFICAFTGYQNAPKHVTIWASICVCCAPKTEMCNSDRIFTSSSASPSSGTVST